MPKVVADEVIYNAAMQTVIERGYSGATTKQIAGAADISEVTLFRKYGSKAGLIKQAIKSVAEQIDFESAARYTGDVSADLLRVARMYQGSAEKNGLFYYAILLEVPRNPDLADVVDTPMNMFNYVGKLLARYQEEGVLKHEHPLHTVAALLGPLMITYMIRGSIADAPLPPIDLPDLVENFLQGRLHARGQAP